MQINIGNVKLLGIVPEESAQGFRIVSESLVQESKVIGAAGVALLPRGNKKLTFTFTVARVHADAETAFYFCNSHLAQFPVQGKLTLLSAKGNITMPGALGDALQGTFTGASTTHSYKVVCPGATGNILTLEPLDDTFSGGITPDGASGGSGGGLTFD